jgi:branched-chain amino acid transport system substrate-binding protein
MKEGGTGLHAFGEAQWWGEELFGIDNALVGDWPVVVIENGKATIKEFLNPSPSGGTSTRTFSSGTWTEMGQMWDQR